MIECPGISAGITGQRPYRYPRLRCDLHLIDRYHFTIRANPAFGSIARNHLSPSSWNISATEVSQERRDAGSRTITPIHPARTKRSRVQDGRSLRTIGVTNPSEIRGRNHDEHAEQNRSIVRNISTSSVESPGFHIESCYVVVKPTVFGSGFGRRPRYSHRMTKLWLLQHGVVPVPSDRSAAVVALPIVDLLQRNDRRPSTAILFINISPNSESANGRSRFVSAGPWAIR